MEGTPVGSEGQSSSHSTRGVVLALLGAVFWGFSATCVSYLTTNFNVDVPWLAFARSVISGPIFLVIAIVVDRKRLCALFKDWKMLVNVVLYAVVGVALIQITYMTAISYLGAGNALLLQETGLILIMFIACIKRRRLPNLTEICALVLALFGTAAIATQGNIGSLGVSPIGLAWGLFTGLALAGYNLIPVRLLDKYGSFITNGCSMTLAAFVLMPFAQPWSVSVEMPLEGWLAFAAVVLVGTVLAYLIYLEGIREAGPVKASLVGVFEPVSGMAISALWLGTAVSPADMVGCVAIVIMMILVARPSE